MNKDKTKRVLVTGAAGFVGRHCLPVLVSQGFDVHAADISVPEDNPYGLHWHQVDLFSAQKTDELMENISPTHLLHFAWYAKPDEYWNSLENIKWVESSLQLLRLFCRHGGKRVVMAGTCAEYDWRYGFCSEQFTPLVPATLYGTCKNALQHLLKQVSQVSGISSAWGRIFFLYGPHENPQRLVASSITALLSNQEAYCRHGMLIRDFLHVQDVAAAFVSLLESENITGPINIASGLPVSLQDIVNTIAGKLGKSYLVRLGKDPYSLNEPELLVADVKRLNSEMNWKPRYDLDHGLEQTIGWWINHSVEK